jgi:hypothetical protein
MIEKKLYNVTENEKVEFRKVEIKTYEEKNNT